MTCEGCGTAMIEHPSADGDDEVTKWKCPRCGSWCFTQEAEVVMGAWLIEGKEWPR